jgi:hypothetical protein
LIPEGPQGDDILKPSPDGKDLLFKGTGKPCEGADFRNPEETPRLQCLIPTFFTRRQSVWSLDLFLSAQKLWRQWGGRQGLKPSLLGLGYFPKRNL